MTTVTTYKPIVGPAAWRGDEIATSDRWIYRLSDEQRTELEQVGTRFVHDDPDLRFVHPDEYPLPITGEAIRAWEDSMDNDHGFVLVRGLRSELYSDALSAAIFFILGLHIGRPMQQNSLGDAFDHIIAITDLSADDPKALGSRTTDRLNFHSDTSDVVALMCLRGAKAGGKSILISGATIYNELLRRRPDLVPLLFEPWYWDWQKQDHDAPAKFYVSPMASLVDGVFSIYAGARMIRSAQDYPEVPRLTAAQIELLDEMDEIFLTPGLALEMDFRPGDIQWLLNYTALHSRTSYTDYRQPELKRHLLRLWLERGGRPLVANFGKHVAKGRGDQIEEAVPPEQARFHLSQIAHPRYDWGVMA
ncbi:taurine dioxygenase [Croceicoccus estronivorus]|uniref:TauD/TfdA family dioxygenase n=1 Tax=Croceicoccus estronivorus TaxID=1172626 RepID=UPI0008356E6B|nr:TauD/TfdA family dioxygenase [Croceicoccus estronivorus]OCC24496.1 taurine dioxygenase [Croceicoccus estronivorus]